MAKKTIRQLPILLSLLLLFSLLPALNSAYLNYDGRNISFGTDGRLSVFTCNTAHCYPGFANITEPPRQISMARPVNDSFVEFVVIRENGSLRNCAMQLNASQPIFGQTSSDEKINFRTGSFEFAITQAEVGETFSIELNLSTLCIVMPENSTKAHFLLMPIRASALPAQAPIAPASVAEPVNMSSNSSSPSGSPPAAGNETAPANAALPPFPLSPTFSQSARAPQNPDLGLSQPPLTWIPSVNYLVLSGLFLALLAFSGKYLPLGRAYLAITLLPLLVGFYYLPIDGFRPIGLILWGILWLGFFLRLVFRRE